MFFKQNNTKELSQELFLNPTSEYCGAPFWCWNCKVDKETIKKQIDIYHEMGVGGFTLHCRTGLETPYMSGEFLELVKYASDYAREKGMMLYLYDEDRYASGAAGGMVTENLRYRQRAMFLSRRQQEELDLTREEFEAKIGAGKKPRGYYLTSYWVLLDEDGCLKEYKRVDKEFSAQKGKVWHAYVKLAKESPWFNDQTYIDVFNKEAVEKFIEVTHERYYKELGDEFGKSIRSIFTDEPQMSGKFAFPTPDSDKDATLSYTDDMNETFEQMFGIELLDIVPEVLWELPDGQVSIHRYHYHDHLAERFAAAFPDTIAKWCEEHDIALTGHYMSERTLYSQTLALSEAMRLYRSMQIPGIDILCDQKELSTAKQAISVARQNGRDAVTSELYGVTHWDADFKTYKLQGDWQAALGVTNRVHHLTFMSMEGEAKRDWPASIGYQSPWYPKFSYIEKHFGRLNTALTRGQARVNVAVVHPIESYWMNFGPNSQTQTIRDQMDENFENLMQWLLYGIIDFDFISESLLPHQCLQLPTTDRLQVGQMSYQAVVVPDCITIRSTTLERLEALAEAGGKVIFAGRVPEYVDAAPSDRARNLAKKCKCVQFSRAEILDALEDDRLIEIRDDKGRYSTNLIYQMRKDNDKQWLFICHVNRKRNVLDKREKYYITIKGLHKVTLYDTITGEIRPQEAQAEDGNTMVKVHVFAEDSLLFLLEDGEPMKTEPAPAYKYNVSTVAAPTDFKLAEPNCLLLDYAEYQFDDGEWQEKADILTIDNAFRREIGLPRRQDHFTQPYRIPFEPIEHKVTLRYVFDSDIEVTGARYAMERPENAAITLNGETIDTSAVQGCYVDEIIRCVPLPTIAAGRNELIVEIPFGRKVNLEWSYILGNFGVEAYGDYAHIVEPPKSLRFGSVVQQRLPFYTGNITYQIDVDMEQDYDDVTLEVPHFAAPVLEVCLDGESKGIIAYAPHKLSLGSVSGGKHQLDIILYGNRFNGFGTLHNANDEFKWYGPDSYRTSGSQWTDSYLFHDMGVLSAVKLHKGVAK